MLPDPDDILSQDCLFFFYNLAKKNDYELIRFYIYTGNRNIYFGYHVKPIPSKPVYQPVLATYLFYALKICRQIDYNVSNKFIKREALIRALNYIGKDIFIYMINFEDGVLNYFLYRTSKSFYLKKKIAYFYIKNRDSITGKGINILDVKFIFLHLNFVFDFSKNNKYEKNMCNILFRRIGIWRKIINRVLHIKDNFDFYLDVVDKYLENEFINNNNKNYLRGTRRNILKAQNANKALIKTNFNQTLKQNISAINKTKTFLYKLNNNLWLFFECNVKNKDFCLNILFINIENYYAIIISNYLIQSYSRLIYSTNFLINQFKNIYFNNN